MRILAVLSSAFLCFLATNPAHSAQATCGPSKLGTAREMKVDASHFRIINGNEKSFGLRHKEVVLTFDDGPISTVTPKILKALKNECVKATFFYVGRMAKAYPSLVRQVVNEGHTLAHHTHSHNNLPKYSAAAASNRIDKGVATLQKIAYGNDSSLPITPFFRYPYLSRNSKTDHLLAKKGMIAFSANIDSLDWKHVSSDEVYQRIMRRLHQEGKGVILMHDIQARTAEMLPHLLRSLKQEGYSIVHLVPASTAHPKSEALLMAEAKTTKRARRAKTRANEKPDLEWIYLQLGGTEPLFRFSDELEFPTPNTPEQKTAEEAPGENKDNSVSIAMLDEPENVAPAHVKKAKEIIETKKVQKSAKKSGFIVLAGRDTHDTGLKQVGKSENKQKNISQKIGDQKISGMTELR